MNQQLTYQAPGQTSSEKSSPHIASHFVPPLFHSYTLDIVSVSRHLLSRRVYVYVCSPGGCGSTSGVADRHRQNTIPPRSCLFLALGLGIGLKNPSKAQVQTYDSLEHLLCYMVL